MQNKLSAQNSNTVSVGFKMRNDANGHARSLVMCGRTHWLECAVYLEIWYYSTIEERLSLHKNFIVLLWYLLRRFPTASERRE